MTEHLGNQKGVSILAAIFMLLVLGIIMAALVGLLSNKEISSAEELLSTQALFLAETGVEIFINESLTHGMPPLPYVEDYPYQNGTIKVEVDLPETLDGQTILEIKSTGTIGEINRKVKVKYRQ